MVMVKAKKIAFMAVMTLVVALFSSCSNETDTTLTQQQTSISNYLKNSHQPRLIPEAEIGESLEENPKFYTQWGLDIYRYISTYYNDDRNSKPVANVGDKLELQYTAYIFKSSQPTINDMFATNDEESIAALEAKGLNTSYEWTTEPLAITLGRGDIIEALEIALEGCREGDSVEIYLTYESGYGNHYVGMVPKKSAQVWYIDILSVTKK